MSPSRCLLSGKSVHSCNASSSPGYARVLLVLDHLLQAEEYELLPNGGVKVHASKLGVARKPEEAAAGLDKGPKAAPPAVGTGSAPENIAQSVSPLLYDGS